MSEPVEPAVGRGAQKRRSLQEQRLQGEALRWWTRPGVVLFVAVLVLSGAGWALLVRATRRLPVVEATLEGLTARFDQATWIADQMDHGENFNRPAVMNPDMPGAGTQRVNVYLTLRNSSAETREYRGEEFYLVPEIGEEVPPFGALIGEAPLQPGQSLNTALSFDLDTTRPHGKLLMRWRRGSDTAHFAIPNPPEHYHLRPRGESLPPDARLLLPVGKAERGERLYAGLYGCFACHGNPQEPGSNNLGPHLADIGTVAHERVQGMPGAQYLYESILEPNAFIAPDCQRGQPCDSPSSMPDYSSLLTLQDAADLLVYLLEQRATERAAEGDSDQRDSR
jgi:hypothetical protein